MKRLYPLTDEELRKVQLVELEILKYVKLICDKHGINYFLDWGTLLGAVRHNGFIPWDNDIDIGMLRKDYEKFCEVFPKEGDSDFILQTWYTDKNWPLSYAKVRKKGTIFITNHVENNQTPECCGFNIDIFIYDDIPDDETVTNALDTKLKHYQRILIMKAGYRPWFSGDNYSFVRRLLYLPYQLIALGCSKDKLVGLSEELIKAYSDNKCVFYHGGTDDILKLDKSIFLDLIELDFEGEKFKCPRNYDSVLTAQYGEYMQLPPEEVRAQRSYVLKMKF